MNLESEVRNGYFISSEMKKVWAVEMELLKRLLKVCEKYHLKIWAEGGTLLGTIRHQGFIPWDDDIDMAMLRDDYDKLQAIAKDEFKAPYFFQSGYTDLFAEGMSKLRMDNTTAIQHDTIFQNCHQGIFIDIFPLDKLPEDKIELETFVSIKTKMKQKLMIYCNHNYSLINLKYNWKVFANNLDIAYKGFKQCYLQYDIFVKKYNNTDSKLVSLISWYYNARYVRDIQWYNETIYMKFEDIVMPVPANYDNILKVQFGDYMTPKKEPSMHRGFMVLDPFESYLFYLGRLRKTYKFRSLKERVKSINKQLKHIFLN